jgi:hypothetical protein
MILQSIRIPCIFKAVKTRNVKTRIKCSSGSDYSEQTFDDVDTVYIRTGIRNGYVTHEK